MLNLDRRPRWSTSNRWGEEPMAVEAGLILDNIRNRRSLPTQKMQDRPLRQEHIDAILEAANWAPSHKHTEPWRFRLYLEAGREPLAQAMCEIYKTASGESYRPAKEAGLRERLTTVPLTIALIMEPDLKAGLPLYEEILAMGCAAQNMHLAAQALGIGCRWSTPGYYDHPDLKAYFEIPDHGQFMGFLFFGYPEGDFPNSKRGAVDQKVKVFRT